VDGTGKKGDKPEKREDKPEKRESSRNVKNAANPHG
jgi:hypothetical protein